MMLLYIQDEMRIEFAVLNPAASRHWSASLGVADGPGLPSKVVGAQISTDSTNGTGLLRASLRAAVQVKGKQTAWRTEPTYC